MALQPRRIQDIRDEEERLTADDRLKKEKKRKDGFRKRPFQRKSEINSTPVCTAIQERVTRAKGRRFLMTVLKDGATDTPT